MSLSVRSENLAADDPCASLPAIFKLEVLIGHPCGAGSARTLRRWLFESRPGLPHFRRGRQRWAKRDLYLQWFFGPVVQRNADPKRGGRA